MKTITIKLPCGAQTTIDEIDLKFKSIFPCWRITRGRVRCTRYIKTEYSSVAESIYLSRLIVNPPKGFVVDHKDRNPLNNTRSNLRLATMNQNAANKSKSKRKTSKYRGVAFKGDRSTKRPWFAYTSRNKKQIGLGFFASEEEAGKAYDKAAKSIWGEFACLNFPD